MQDRRIGVRPIIWNGSGLFVVLLIREEGDGQNSYWCTPGGGLDLGESLQDGLRREVIEELGVEPKIGKLLFIQQFASPREECHEELEFFFHVENWQDFVEIDLSKTTHGVQEVHEYGFFDPSSRRILPSFLSKIDISAAIDSGEVQVISYLNN